jgi:hypothetical protein
MLRGATPSGAVCSGSNLAGGTQHELPKDPVTSGGAEVGVFAYVQYAGRVQGDVVVTVSSPECLRCAVGRESIVLRRPCGQKTVPGSAARVLGLQSSLSLRYRAGLPGAWTTSCPSHSAD